MCWGKVGKDRWVSEAKEPDFHREFQVSQRYTVRPDIDINMKENEKLHYIYLFVKGGVQVAWWCVWRSETTGRSSSPSCRSRS